MANIKTVEAVRKELYCPHCKFILRDAVQTDNGTRLCQGCFEEILQSAEKKCDKCGVDLKEGSDSPTDPQCQKDRAIRKEILLLLVYCKWNDNGCMWTGKHQDLEAHCRECNYGIVECPNHCGAKLQQESLDAHMQECPQRETGCSYCKEKFRYREMERHLLQCPHALIKCETCGKEMERNKLSGHENNECRWVECNVCNEKVDRAIPGHMDDPVKVFSHIQSVGKKICTMQQKLDELTSLVEEYKTSKYKYRDIEVNFNKRLDSLELSTKQLKEINETLTTTIPIRRYELGTEKGSLEKRLEEQEKSNQLLKVRISELELQLQASLASTHNGAFLWRIPDVARRKRDAIDERITSIYSPPFYTGRNGYKMCIRAYLNGDGLGYKTHLSIFFVLMKGEYDPLLKWPFDHKVSLILVDQNHRKHIVQTFKPTPESSSFQRPRTDMNVASGCPQFSKLDVLDDPSYVKDDVMYIKGIVDTSRIFHP